MPQIRINIHFLSSTHKQDFENLQISSFSNGLYSKALRHFRPTTLTTTTRSLQIPLTALNVYSEWRCIDKRLFVVEKCHLKSATTLAATHHQISKGACDGQFVVMGRTPFYRTSNELEHHFSNIKQTQTCLYIDDRTWTPEFWLWMNGHRTLNLKGLH